jgi:hypothetical protein
MARERFPNDNVAADIAAREVFDADLDAIDEEQRANIRRSDDGDGPSGDDASSSGGK